MASTKLKFAVISVIMLLSATAGYGKDCKGIPFADHAQFRGTLLTLNGLGLRQASVFKISVYVVALYLTEL
jgi:hypothetical protein